jgi:hypothetical protein
MGGRGKMAVLEGIEVIIKAYIKVLETSYEG